VAGDRLTRPHGNPPAVAEEARRLRALAETLDATRYDLTPAAWAGLGEELRALALVSLGITSSGRSVSRRQNGTWTRASR
jgi:hypothetical protein